VTRWSNEEMALLFLKYEHVSWTELKGLFPSRSKKSINKKARELRLVRTKFSTLKGVFYVYALCPTHGRIFREEIKWRGKKENIPYCPRPGCNKRLREKPKTSRLRRKYRIERVES